MITSEAVHTYTFGRPRQQGGIFVLESRSNDPKSGSHLKRIGRDYANKDRAPYNIPESAVGLCLLVVTGTQ